MSIAPWYWFVDVSRVGLSPAKQIHLIRAAVKPRQPSPRQSLNHPRSLFKVFELMTPNLAMDADFENVAKVLRDTFVQ